MMKAVIVFLIAIASAAAYTEVECTAEEELECLLKAETQKEELEKTCDYDLVKPPTLCGCYVCPQGVGEKCDMDPAFYVHGSCGRNSTVKLECEDKTVVPAGEFRDPRNAKGECVASPILPCAANKEKECEDQALLKELYQTICPHTLVQPPTSCGCYVCPRGKGEECDMDPSAHNHGPCVDGLECRKHGEKATCCDKSDKSDKEDTSNTVRMILNALVKSI